MIPASFKYHAPDNLGDALAILQSYPGDAKLLAGGQSLLPMMKFRMAQPGHLVDLRRIDGLSYIRGQDGGLSIGSMTRYYMLQSSHLVQQCIPMLTEAVGLVADVQVRNLGTIGGSVAHADPGGDLPAVLLALGARLSVTDGGAGRTIDSDGFFLDVFTTALRETEIITEIFLPSQLPRTGGSYQKFADKASHFAIVGVVALVTLDEMGTCQRVRIAVTGAGPMAVRAATAEQYLTGQKPSVQNIEGAASLAPGGIEFITDLNASAQFRKHLTQVLAARALAQAVSRVQ